MAGRVKGNRTMTVKELIDLLSTQPGDYEVAVRTIDDDISEIRDDLITELAEVEAPDDGMPGYVTLNYENNVLPELEDDELEDYAAGKHDEIEDDEDDSNIQGPDGREWTFNQFATWVISLTIRNTLEMFHGGGAMDPEHPNRKKPRGFITDRQMKAMNIVIRYKVYEVLSAISNPDRVIDEKLGFTNGQSLGFTMHYINDYMERPGSPELEEAYQRIKNGQFDPQGFVPDCTRSEPPYDPKS
jgi:hypothetical protein